LRTYDYVVANPPFSDKTWSTGLTLGESGKGDRHKRFTWGVPPKKQGDYAYLLHIVRSMKSTGKGACILPHGVLFRGGAEATIRQNLVRSGILRGIIGLPANLFYGTGIPACILVLDKENATARKGIFMIDASKGFRKDGAKNRLREQDIHKIVDTFRRQDESDARYARRVPLAEIADAKNDYNLNLPRYIDSNEPEDLQDIDGHLRGEIPERDLEALRAYWRIMPALRSVLFDRLRPGYCQLKLPLSEVNPYILSHAEFMAFNDSVTGIFTQWEQVNTPHLMGFGKDGHPKALIESISESLLASFKAAPLLDAYDVYQHLMDYWAETMQDDAYLISAVGWTEGAKPHEIRQVKNKDGKLVWPEKEDYKRGRRRFKSDLLPAAMVIDRYFAVERDAIAALEAQLAAIEQQLDEQREEQGGEDGQLAQVAEGEGDKQKITAKALKSRLMEIGKDPDYVEERAALKDYAALLGRQADINATLKTAQEMLHEKLDARYRTLTEDEIKMLVVDDKWLGTLAAALQSELDRVSQTLTNRIRQLAECYATPLPQLSDEITALAARVEGHLKQMGAVWD
jgi:type I restriction enzyme M protein